MTFFDYSMERDRREGSLIGWAIALGLAALLWGAIAAYGQPVSRLTASTVRTNYPVSLAWNAVPGATGYKVYFGPVSLAQTNFADVGNVTACTLHFPMPETRQLFYVAAYDEHGQISGPSNEVYFPGDTVTEFAAWASTDLTHWTRTNLPLVLTNPGGSLFIRTTASNRMEYGNP